jgi:2-polyprenyl-6-hydroxyphenyl methylase / 3-demethylubiquinone-9 3-methyltransferase
MEIEAGTRQSRSVDAGQLRIFAGLAEEWWDERGKFRGLHAFNPARLAFMVEEVQRRFPARKAGPGFLARLAVADIGCGGGILAEPLARLGAQVTGVDPVEESIGAARAHADKLGLAIDYRAGAAEDLVEQGLTFDAIIASEVLEHVADTGAFLATCRALCKPRAILILSTLNRTLKSFGLAIVAAEHVLGLIPRGTHDWKKFIRPEELDGALHAAGFERMRQSGIVFNPIRGTWGLSPSDMSVNYIVSAEAL